MPQPIPIPVLPIVLFFAGLVCAVAGALRRVKGGGGLFGLPLALVVLALVLVGIWLSGRGRSAGQKGPPIDPPAAP